MNVNIKGINVDLWDSTREFIEQKMADALKAMGRTALDRTMVDVEIRFTEAQRDAAAATPFRAEAVVTSPGLSLRAVAEAAELRPAIVELKRVLTRQVRDERERRLDRKREGARRLAAGLPAQEVDTEAEVDPEAV